MESDGVENYHCEDKAKVLLFSIHEMEARVQNNGLASDGAAPTDDDQSHICVGSIWVGADAFEEKSN